MGRFNDRVVLVVGSSSGIGEATAVQLAREGATVICAARRTERVGQLVARIQAEGGEARGIAVDLANPDSIDALFDEIERDFAVLDGAFNNAGIDLRYAEIADIRPEELDLAIATNFRGTFLCMMREARIMRAQGSGSIVNTASVAGTTGLRLNAAYVASKHAVVGMTKAAALDMGPHGVRVNCICPGSILTEMVERNVSGNPAARRAREDLTPLGRLGRPDEISETALWLLSGRSSYVTGAVLPADGGVTAGIMPPASFSRSQGGH